MKYLPKTVIKETIIIGIIATILGLFVNFIHPNGIQITAKRPPIEFAPDSVFAVDLPDASISLNQEQVNENKIEEISFFISLEQLTNLIKKEQVVLIDARSESEYSKGHLPHAINLPYEELFDYYDKVNSLPADKWLVCYCDGPDCDLSEKLSFDLFDKGFTNVCVYKGGIDEWLKAGNNLEN